ncbi:MAG: dockerin type I repeat-containing protein, partial [Clostridia bacterium]|nr:dockerin type I repeat-containing protein [Clostridia bacterium]
VYCSVCEAELSRETVVIPPTGHIPSEAVEEIVDLTCIAAGHMDSVVYCSVCGLELSRETVGEVPAAGHTWGEWTIISAPTTERTGIKMRVCVNDPSHVEYVPLRKLTYAYGDVNGDEVITCIDASLILQYVANYDEETGMSSVEFVGVACADVNCDGNITGMDASLILQYVANYDDETGKSTVVLGPQN